MDEPDDLIWAQQHWQHAGTIARQTATEAELVDFAAKHQVQLPADIVHYFTLVNGTGGEYDELFFCFNSLAEVQSIADRFQYYHGVPKYSDLLHTWPEHRQFYVFADYMIHLFAYAIRLDASAATNPVFVLCGGKYELIAESLGYH